MLPSIISSELEQAAKDSISTSFNPTTDGFRNLIDRFLSGQVQPADLPGTLAYMNLGPGEMGKDAHDYAWAAAFKKQVSAA